MVEDVAIPGDLSVCVWLNSYRSMMVLITKTSRPVWICSRRASAIMRTRCSCPDIQSVETWHLFHFLSFFLSSLLILVLLFSAHTSISHFLLRAEKKLTLSASVVTFSWSYVDLISIQPFVSRSNIVILLSFLLTPSKKFACFTPLSPALQHSLSLVWHSDLPWSRGLILPAWHHCSIV